MYLAASAHIKQLDKLVAEKYGIPEHQLMEQAGMSIYRAIQQDVSARKFAVFCGKGNNGGDGFVVARLLDADGCDVNVYLTHEESELSETAKIAFEKLKKTKVLRCKITDPVDEGAVVIDALLGISISGAPRGAIKEAIDRITEMNQTVISIDIPSGLSADSGEAPGSVVKADRTYTLALDKIGLNSDLGTMLCGEKKVLDIGVPKAAVEEVLGLGL